MIYFTHAQREFQSFVRDFAREELSRGAQERAKLEHTTDEVLGKLADAAVSV